MRCGWNESYYFDFQCFTSARKYKDYLLREELRKYMKHFAMRGVKNIINEEKSKIVKKTIKGIRFLKYWFKLPNNK